MNVRGPSLAYVDVGGNKDAATPLANVVQRPNVLTQPVAKGL